MTRKLTPFLLVVALSRLSAANALLFNDPPRRKDVQLKTNTPAAAADVTWRLLKATKDDTETTWSAKAGSSRESRLGVRRRVRAVLAKARQRTGVNNDSEVDSASGSISGKSMAMQLEDRLMLEATLGEWSFAAGDLKEASKNNGAALATPVTSDLALDKLNSDATLSVGASLSTEDFESCYEMLSPQKRNGYSVNNGKSTPASGSETPAKVDDADVETREDIVRKAARQPLPFTLPSLTPKQRKALDSGERVQEQTKMSGEGSGFVVMDIAAPEYAIWEVLLDFEAYPDNIGTVRSMTMFTNTHLGKSFFAEKPMPPGAAVRHYGKASISRARFILSKFRLSIAAVHRYQPHPDGHYMVFTLDKACQNVVLRDAKGIWYTESNPDGKEDVTRVWLLCELKVSPLLPSFIVDYAAKRAMPRATTWLPPAVQSFMEREKEKQP